MKYILLVVLFLNTAIFTLRAEDNNNQNSNSTEALQEKINLLQQELKSLKKEQEVYDKSLKVKRSKQLKYYQGLDREKQIVEYMTKALLVEVNYFKQAFNTKDSDYNDIINNILAKDFVKAEKMLYKYVNANTNKKNKLFNYKALSYYWLGKLADLKGQYREVKYYFLKSYELASSNILVVYLLYGLANTSSALLESKDACKLIKTFKSVYKSESENVQIVGDYIENIHKMSIINKCLLTTP